MKITDIIGNNNPKEKSVAMSGKDTVVGVNAQFTGNIMFSQNLKISGTVKGNIDSNDDNEIGVVHTSSYKTTLKNDRLCRSLYG